MRRRQKRGNAAKTAARRGHRDRKPVNEFAAWQASLTPRERHVGEVVELMADGRWRAGSSHEALARKWGVTPGTVNHVAAEANRVLRLAFRQEPEARKDVLARVLATFESIGERARKAKSVAGMRVELDAALAFGRYYGVEPPKNVRMVDTDPDGLGNLTDEELEAVSKGGVEALRDIRQRRQNGAH